MIALVRPISDTFADALRQDAASPPPDVVRAREEHAAYVDALGRFARITEVPACHAAPDACFVEDVVVVARGTALLTRPGAPSRRREVDAVRAALPNNLEVVAMTEGILEGGDVLQVGDHLLVGRSGRTDAAGVAALRQTFEPLGLTVRAIPVPDALHLKCHLTAVRPDLLLLAEGFADPRNLEDLAEIAVIPAREAYAANVIGLGRHVLVADGYPAVAERLTRAGCDPIPLAMREIARADGSLTCLSVRIPEPEDRLWPRPAT